MDYGAHENSGGRQELRLIYVADRYWQFCETICALLSIEGYEVALFSDQPSLLIGLSKRRPYAVVLDRSLGVENGTSTLRVLRSQCPDVPVFMTLQDPDMKASAALMALGAWGVFPKPIDAARLIGAVATKAALSEQAHK